MRVFANDDIGQPVDPTSSRISSQTPVNDVSVENAKKCKIGINQCKATQLIFHLRKHRKWKSSKGAD